MSRRLSLAVRLVALVGIAGGLSGCAVYGTPGYGYGYGAPGYYRPAPYYRSYGAWGYGRPYRGYGYGRPYGRPFGGFYGRPYW